MTDAVNYVFSALMNERLGGVDYSAQGEKLVAAARYEREAVEPQAEYHVLIPPAGVRADSVQSRLHEAEYIASVIKETVESGTEVQSGDCVRPAKYGDFCILLRSLKTKGRIYAEALSKAGVPVCSVSDEGFFDAAEIRFVLSLLRVIDNPARDVELLAVMLSPIFGFSPDDISRCRMNGKGGNLYSDIVLAASEGDEKYGVFLRKLRYYRSLACALDVGDLITSLYEDTGFCKIAGAMSHPAQRRKNLIRMREYADNYESKGSGSLSGFIRFTDALIERGAESASGSGAVLGDAVNIMTIHKSKGLEFPFVIIADCASGFKNTDFTGELVLERSMGAGLKRCIPEEMKKFACISHSAAAQAAKRAQLSEELRVLYVAMTRARERIIAVASMSEKALKDTALDVSAGLGVESSDSAQSYAKWLSTAFINHPDASALREAAGLDRIIPKEKLSGQMKIRVEYVSDEPAAEVPAEEPEVLPEMTEEEVTRRELETKELLAEIRARADYVYPYSALFRVSAKRTASQGDERFDSSHFACDVPAFMQSGGLTAAQKGTAAHAFLEVCDFSAARLDARAELRRAVESGRLTSLQADSINLNKLEKFFSGELVGRMLSSRRVLREYKFTMGLRASELYEEIPENSADETVIVQGKLDCAFFENGSAVLVDYKTDRVSSPQELISRYSQQLELYKKALERCEGVNVSEVYLYSVELGEAIRLDIR